MEHDAGSPAAGEPARYVAAPDAPSSSSTPAAAASATATPAAPPAAPPAAAAAGSASPGGFARLARLAPGALAASYADLCAGAWPVGPEQLPVVYHPSYNISFFGIEKLHPFDSGKFAKVVKALKREGVLRGDGQLVTPREATPELLADVHTEDYLHRIHNHNFTVVQVTELAPLAMLPNRLLQWRVVAPMRMHVGGTMLALGLALERGWAVNVGGGMHHASAGRGMGWCPFDDIMLGVRRARRAVAAAEGAGAEAAAAGAAGAAVAAAGGSGTAAPGADAAVDAAAAGAAAGNGGDSGGGVGGGSLKVLVIDLDAHQGNGVEHDKLTLGDTQLFILDMYNAGVFPRDDEAKAAIDIKVELKSGTEDDIYLNRLRAALERAALVLPKPDLVVYNAGTDILAGDPLGRLAVSPAGVVERDELVWRWSRDVAQAPIAMLLSGGYAKDSAAVISTSLANLFNKFDLNPAPGA
ncbi:hypothetical protein HYH02_000864 [Chlamydomonas schloesseri]|uniref:Histone deacetylase domain-containing protein n=1 Tax=Chlamydomonas schloesseri TaxID=2026947 RepID=A0A835WVF3_9CHLO|nr:hypothetical protein HYH02_000864 [Chlamydomonas schloesseri]|eukprot:KAG2455039.1 hypothetical protein HYH02_000864 [Chlamydomonas schloesseri]